MASVTPLSPIVSTLRLPLSPLTFASSTSDTSINFVLLSFIASSSSWFAILCCFLFFIADDNLLSAISGCILSLIVNDNLLSLIFGGSSFSPVLSASFWVLFLLNILSYAHYFSLRSLPLFHSSLPSLLISLIYSPTPFIRKRLFDQTFITQRLIASIQQQEKPDLSFEKCLYGASIKINRL